MLSHSRPVVMALAAIAALVVSAVGVPTGTATGQVSRAPAAVPTPRWGTSYLLNDPGRFNLDVAVDPQGRTTVVGTEDGGRPSAIYAVRRQAGGAWTSPKIIGFGTHPQVATDARGNVTVVWSTHRRGFSDGVRAARRPIRSPWRHPVQLSNDKRVPGYVWPGPNPYAGCDCKITHGAARVELDVNARGVAIVTWDWGSEWMNAVPGIPSWIQAVLRVPGQPWRRPVDLTRHPARQRNSATNEAAGLGSGRHALALYSIAGQLKARDLAPGHGWKPPRTLATGVCCGVADVEVDSRGDALAVFQAGRSLRSVSRPAGKPWTAAETIYQGAPRTDLVPAHPSLVMDGSGTATVAWGTVDWGGDGAGDEVYADRRPAGGAWGAPRFLPQLSDIDRPDSSIDVTDGKARLSANPAGDLMLTTGGEQGQSGTYRPHDGDWTPRFLISYQWWAIASAIYPDGRAIALWRSDPGHIRIREMTSP